MKIALLGLENSGKKTFFSLLTRRAKAADGKNLNIKDGEIVEGIAPIYDVRVDKLAELFKPKRVKYAENNIVLCPDIVIGANKKDWVDVARKCDLLCIIIRDFQADDVYHPYGSVDANRDKSVIESEILLTDLELIERRLERIDKERKSGLTNQQILEESTLKKLKNHIEGNAKLILPVISSDEALSIRSLSLFIVKPTIWVYNVDEGRLGKERSESNEFNVSCKLEEEIMSFGDEKERRDFMKNLGIELSGLDRLNSVAYSTMGLMSFYTVGSDEVRAWSIKKGTKAPEAGGKVHSDIQKGFIRVEIMKYDDLIKLGSESAVKAAGKIQLKGKDYIIEDGDICHFRFNV